MTLNTVLAAIGLITFIVYTIFNILYLVDLKKTSAAIRQLIAKTDENLNPAISELKSALQDIRKLTGDLSSVIERVRTAATAVVSVEKTIQYLYDSYREGFSQSAQGLKTGLRVGVATLVKNLKRMRDGQP